MPPFLSVPKFESDTKGLFNKVFETHMTNTTVKAKMYLRFD
ncbi:44664_t:CDS:2 [Gigaspora margarita]|uniref:44664_t:CDS:1 n=1 Tax=Gigaspora margarita TaxID=4874 RepID=A0ABN7UFM6_GIGMA|nr:44664_t:CDS:2 [Gigaspora margarita]